MNIDEKLKNEIKNLILEEIDVDIIYIFGSYAQNLNNEDSDIDIAFFTLKDYSNYKIFLLAQKISLKLGKEIDLIQLKNSSTVFQKEVVSKGKIIFEKNKIEREKFENLVLKKYIKLNEERKEIFDNYEV